MGLCRWFLKDFLEIDWKNEDHRRFWKWLSFVWMLYGVWVLSVGIVIWTGVC